MDTKPLLIAMVGLPRSGKSTIVKELQRSWKAPIVRRDDIRLALHGQRYQILAEDFVKAISLVMIRSLFLSGHKAVICDETNYSKAARNTLKSDKWDTVFHEVFTGPIVCCERAIATGQDDLVPVIWEMANRYEALTDEEQRYSVDLLDRITEKPESPGDSSDPSQQRA